MKNIRNRFITGFIPGLLLPVPGIYMYYLLFFHYMGFQAFLRHILRTDLFVSVLSIGVILNLGLFFLFYRFEMDQPARGVIGATFIYAFIVLYFKVIR